MLYVCRVCNEYRYTRSSPLWKGVPWIVCLDGDYCCKLCHDAHNGPGKFEACIGSNRSELGKALILYSWSLDSSEDDYMSNDGWGYCGRFGQYLLFEDTRGAVSYWDEGTEEKADKEFQRLYRDGWGSSEDDAYISQERYGRWYVTMGGKEINVWENKLGEVTARRCIAAVSLEMRKQGYYPNVWIVNERGDLQLAERVW